MSIVNRIKDAAAQNGTSIPQIEHELGFGNRTLYRWDKNSPSMDKVISVANLLNVSVSWLATGVSETKNIVDNSHSEEEDIFLNKYRKLSDLDKTKINYFMEICLLDVPSKKVSYNNIEGTNSKTSVVREAAATYKTQAKEIAVLGYVAAGEPIEGISIPLGYISAPVSADYALIAKGHSMEPVIQDGEYIFVRNCESLNLEDIGIFYIDGNVTCKQYSPTSSTMVLRSLNPDFTPFKYPLTEQHDFKIQGKVILTEDQKQRFS